MNIINVLILAAGKAPSQSGEREYPLCLTEFGNTSLIEKIIQNTSKFLNVKYSFVFLENESQKYHLDKIVSLIAKDSKCVLVPDHTQGSACTALICASQLDQEGELLIISANELVDLDLTSVVDNFKERKLDAGTLIFRSLNPRYSFVSLDQYGFVKQTAQKEPISENATVGIFWYAKTSDFVNGAKNLIRKDAKVDGKYFVAPVFNELVLRHKKIGVVKLPLEKYTPLKSEQQIDLFQRGY
jgi:hypothetical protein